jgi:HEAT repeat protein
VKKTDPLEQRLRALDEIRNDPSAPESAERLRQALAARESFLVARAAALAAELQLAGLAPDLEASLARWMAPDPKRDPVCRAKVALVRALGDLERHPVELLAAGMRLVQMEPGFGGPTDTAAELRAVCALGLARSGARDAALRIVPLLLDASPLARRGAVDALGACGQLEAEGLLRFKALLGDEEPEVISTCLASLLLLAPARSLAFVEALLEARDAELRGAAILALGDSRLEAAADLLVGRFEQFAPDERRLALLALVASRCDRALEFALSEVRGASDGRAADALEALEPLRQDARMRERIDAAVAERESD